MANIIKLKENLEKNGFRVSCFKNRAEAVAYLSEEIVGSTVGIGGSKTIEEIGLYDQLLLKNDVAWHWKQEPISARKRAEAAEVYICSANAVSETGEIVNIDGAGNRIAGTIYGKKKVYFVVGTNKIVESLEKAIWRARNVAAPMNTKRFGYSTPCATAGEMKCYDCSHPQRICKGLLVFWRKMTGVEECEVVVIEESIGF